MAWDAHSASSSGGTELIARRIEERLPAALLDRFQIMLSKPAPPEDGRIPVLWCHLMPSDLEAAHLADGGWRRFARIVFVSTWQARRFVRHYGIPWSRCQVIPNSIVPFPEAGRWSTPLAESEPVRLVYCSVPDRGLIPLLHAFRFVRRVREDVELDVFSGYGLYGWHEADEQMRPLYDALRETPGVRFHGAVPNHEVRAALRRAHVHAHPTVVPETSCLALIEAMSAGLACVHPDLGGLHETAAGRTLMYPYDEDPSHHVRIFVERLLATVQALRTGDPGLRDALTAQKEFADRFYDVDRRAREWEEMLSAALVAA